jgi:hypothetical protein
MGRINDNILNEHKMDVPFQFFGVRRIFGEVCSVILLC